MGNNHGMTPGYIAIADEQRKAAFSWRWSSAVKTLRELDPGFDTWFDSYPEEMTKGEMLPLIEARVLSLEAPQKRVVAIGRIAPGVNVMVVDPEISHESILARNEAAK